MLWQIEVYSNSQNICNIFVFVATHSLVTLCNPPPRPHMVQENLSKELDTSSHLSLSALVWGVCDKTRELAQVVCLHFTYVPGRQCGWEVVVWHTHSLITHRCTAQCIIKSGLCSLEKSYLSHSMSMSWTEGDSCRFRWLDGGLDTWPLGFYSVTQIFCDNG